MKSGWMVMVVGLVACTPKTQQVGELETEDDDGSSGDDDESGTPLGECQAPELAASFAAFESAIAASDGTYHYSTYEDECIGETDETGCILRCEWETALEVHDGVVTRRRMTLSFADEGVECTGVPFEESGDQLGSHDDEPFVGPMRTVEELYGSCCEDVFPRDDEPDSDLNFNTDDNGIMTSCSLVSKECAEGCEVELPGGSIRIWSFGVGPLP